MQADTDGLTALPELATALMAGGYTPVPDYRDLYTAASSARFPAKRIRSRWYVHPRDYPKVAAAMNLRRSGGKHAV